MPGAAAAAAAGEPDAPRAVGSCVVACARSADGTEAPPIAFGGENPGPPPGGPPPGPLIVLGAGALGTAGAWPPLVPMLPIVDTAGVEAAGA